MITQLVKEQWARLNIKWSGLNIKWANLTTQWRVIKWVAGSATAAFLGRMLFDFDVSLKVTALGEQVAAIKEQNANIQTNIQAQIQAQNANIQAQQANV
ncbi:uncharacterized protein DFL_009834 [Arthrobotrys flagrans]|uniref:Uncharacterized protein n=1 Tax=Arthrobotrys flagrans TaxID=97331 RepID=A0A436ZSR4_ARTFL|nr:hypothetical protein DFL_009834 [Arthrobotrys flagrans]